MKYLLVLNREGSGCAVGPSFLSVFVEARRSGIPEQQEQNVPEHHHA